jgi:sec-independent protein translocase protein TatB
MLNVGPLELLVVLAVALVVVGPERLPELARSVGRVLRQFREVQDEVRDMVASGVDDEMREAASEFREAAGGLTRAADVKGAVRRAERGIREGVTSRSEPRATSARADAEGEEAGGPPAERLGEDASAEPPPGPSEPTTPPAPSDPGPDAEPERPSHP